MAFVLLVGWMEGWVGVRVCVALTDQSFLYRWVAYKQKQQGLELYPLRPLSHNLYFGGCMIGVIRCCESESL